MKTGSTSPIFVSGRQYSGNTMLTRMLGRHSDRYAFAGEGTFFERLQELQRMTDGEDRRREVAHVIATSGGPPAEEVLTHIRGGRSRSPIGEYEAAKEGIARETGASGWVQKATSYVFYVEGILECLPEAHLIFLVRNPLDISASLKRRDLKHGWTRMLWGWNWGVRQARTMAKQYPDHVRIVRYEDLVTETAEALQDICAFCGIPYEQRCLEVPHVNRSETPYNQDSATRGVDDSRVFYFRRVLRPEEQAAVHRLADAEALQALYPDLPGTDTGASWRKGVETLRVLARGGLDLVESQVKSAVANPRWTWQRIRRRLS